MLYVGTAGFKLFRLARSLLSRVSQTPGLFEILLGAFSFASVEFYIL